LIFFTKKLCLGKTAITFAYEVGLKSFLYEKVSTRKVTTDKMAITFAYEVGLKSFLYEKVSTRKVTTEFNRSFRQILDSQNSKGKIDFFALLYFQIFIFRSKFILD
jgi:hypothetical protein